MQMLRFNNRQTEIARARRAAAIPQGVLAAALGVSRITIYNWEKGLIKDAKRDVIVRIIRILSREKVENARE